MHVLRAQGKFAVTIIGEGPHLTLSHPLTSHRENQGSERAWALSRVTQRSETAGASRGWVPWGRLHCALPGRKSLRSAAWTAGEEEQVWLRDWQALGAEPGPALRKTTYWGLTGGRTRVETSCLERESPHPGMVLGGGLGALCPNSVQSLWGRVGTWVGSRAKWRPPAAPRGDVRGLPACSSALVYRDLGGQ